MKNMALILFKFDLQFVYEISKSITGVNFISINPMEIRRWMKFKIKDIDCMEINSERILFICSLS